MRFFNPPRCEAAWQKFPMLSQNVGQFFRCLGAHLAEREAEREAASRGSNLLIANTSKPSQSVANTDICILEKYSEFET